MRLSLLVAYIQPGFWLHLSMLLEGPATGQTDEGFSVVLVVQRENLELVPKFTLHCMLIMRPSTYKPTA